MSEIENLNTHQLWNLMETAFVRPRSINFDNHIFLTTKNNYMVILLSVLLVNLKSKQRPANMEVKKIQ